LTASTSQWRSKGAYFSHRGHRIFWREEGEPSAPVLLLIHGFPTASWDWEKLWPALTAKYRVLTLDMIGFGFSAKPYLYDYRIMDQADIYSEFLAERGVSQYHMLAHDYGDSVAQELTARDIEKGAGPRLQSVCLLNGGLFPETHRRVFLQSLLLSPFGPLLSLFVTKGVVAKNMTHLFGSEYPIDEATIDAIWDLIANNNGSRIMHKLIHYIPDRIEYRERWVGALQRTTVPVKLIDGLVDPVSGGHMVVRFRELVPKANVTELPGVGHYPQVQAPQAVLDAYLAFRDAYG
jgi:pimeloyl-ACP methyl ester carboxylesterase